METRATYRTSRRRGTAIHLGSAPERVLETQLIQVGITGWQREKTFHPVRKWRADFLFTAAMLMVECDGSTFQAGRHTRGKGYAEDRIRDAEAVLLGWRVLRFTTQQIEDGTALKYIEAALRGGAERRVLVCGCYGFW